MKTENEITADSVSTQTPENKARTAQKKIIKSFLLKIVATALIFTLIFSFVLGISTAKGEGMYPRIRDGDLLLWYRLSKDYHVGDVVTFSRNGERYIARIVAVGGETVDLSDDGSLIVNGNIREEEVFYPTLKDGSEISFPVTISTDSFFLLCDFRTNGEDSRIYGTVSQKETDGKIMSILRRRGI